MLNYFKTNEAGVIVELLSFNDPVPVYDDEGEIIGYEDDVNDYIKANYQKTDKEIVQLVDGTYAFASDVDYEEEERKAKAIELEIAKENATTHQYEKYQKIKYGIAWVERADGTKIGFDTDIDQGSQTDWNSVRRVIDDNIALGAYPEGTEPFAPYKYWTSDTEKEYGIVTLTELRMAGIESSKMQNAAYVEFEKVKAEIAQCTTIEEVQKYLVD